MRTWTRLARAILIVALCAPAAAEEGNPQQSASAKSAASQDAASEQAGEDPNRKEFPAVGFGITKPEDWSFLESSILKPGARGRGERLPDKQLIWRLRKRGNLPLITMQRHPDSYAGVNPTVRVFLNPIYANPFWNGEPIRALEIMSAAKSALSRDFEVLAQPAGTEVSGRKGSRARYAYTLAGGDGKDYPAVEHTWFTHRGYYMFVVEMVSHRDEAEDFDALFAQVFDSIRIDP